MFLHNYRFLVFILLPVSFEFLILPACVSSQLSILSIPSTASNKKRPLIRICDSIIQLNTIGWRDNLMGKTNKRLSSVYNKACYSYMTWLFCHLRSEAEVKLFLSSLGRDTVRPVTLLCLITLFFLLSGNIIDYICFWRFNSIIMTWDKWLVLTKSVIIGLNNISQWPCLLGVFVCRAYLNELF